MIHAGIDIGSRFIKFIALRDGRVIEKRRVDTGHAPQQACEALIKEIKPNRIVTTGYGRQLLQSLPEVKTVTEIKSVAKGVFHEMPECRTIIDIGGQDMKAISLGANGKVTSFEMNDRCAAGTGRFLEVMVRNLEFTLDQLGELKGECDIKINSLCTVFAESEVISLIARGVPRETIGLAVQGLVADKVSAMAKRQTLADTVVFTGGCAFNQCLRKLIEARIAHPIVVSPQSPYLAAYGAAILASES